MRDAVRGDPPERDDGPEYDLDFRANPGRYRPTDDERGVFKIEPYKSELLPLWTVSDLDEATEAAGAIRDRYEQYRDREEFVGMDLARKYLRMGWTRALRYAKYPGGTKYDDGEKREPQEWYDEEKHAISQVYRDHLDAVREDPEYGRLRERHERQYGDEGGDERESTE